MKNELPIIRIISEEEEVHVKLKLEMEDETMAILVRWGKEEATDDDYVNIAVREGLLNAIKEAEKDEDSDK